MQLLFDDDLCSMSPAVVDRVDLLWIPDNANGVSPILLFSYPELNPTTSTISTKFYANVETFSVINTGLGVFRLVSLNGYWDELRVNVQNPLYPSSTASTNAPTPAPWTSTYIYYILHI